MRKFTENTWGEKANFADENNVLVGYDMAQDCCEDAKWEFHSALPATDANRIELSDNDLLPFRFDREFFQESGVTVSYLDNGGAVAFRIVSPEREAFLVLSNCHNGYYSHGFSMEVGGQTIRSGSL